MRLISSFRDFYDGAQGADREREPVFTRKTVEENISWGDKRRQAELEPFWSLGNTDNLPWCDGFSRAEVHSVRVAFCGKGYVFYKWDERLFTTPMELEEYVRALPPRKDDPYGGNPQKALLKTFGELSDDRGIRVYGAPLPTRKNWERLNFQSVVDMPTELFRREGTPILSWGSQMDMYERYRVHGTDGGPILVKNPNLQKMQLHRVWPVAWVWQELDMFLGNQMATQFDPSSARTDELARDYHGFDDMSFKNVAPGERKLRRKQNKERKRGSAAAQEGTQ